MTPKFSEVPLMTPVLCTQKGVKWSSILEVVKLNYSENNKAVYVRVIIGGSGPNSSIQHYWVTNDDERYEILN